MIQRSQRSSAARNAAASLLALACFVACALLTRGALAAQCLTSPFRLPGLGGPPTWFDPGASSPPWRAELNDPRWASSPVYPLCADLDLASCAHGVANAQFRVLLDGGMLYLAIHNLADDTITSDDAVFVGVRGPEPVLNARVVSIGLGGGSAVAVPAHIPSDPTAPAPAPPSSVVTFTATTPATPANWSAEKLATDPTMPDWLPSASGSPNIALWRDSVGVQWAVTLKIDLTEFGYSLPISGKIRLFVGSRHRTSVLGTVRLPNVTANTVGGAETIVPANASAWTEFEAIASCSGIEIDTLSIGVWNGAGPLSSSIETCPSSPPWPAGCPGVSNQFRVVPNNVPVALSSGSTEHTVRARLRLADWGSTIDSWPHAPWRDMPGIGTPLEDATLGPPAWQWIPDAMGSPTIGFQCSVIGGNSYCPAITNAGSGAGQSRHQCMLVELGARPGGLNLAFANKAAYRNMIFSNLSSTSDDATITIKGLQALTGKAMARDLYLYVQTRNMPAHADAPLELRPELMDALLGYAENPPPRPVARRRGDDGPVGVAPTFQVEKFSPVSFADIVAGRVKDIRRLPAANNPLLLPTLTGDQALGLAWPSYRVYVYYDTGEREVVSGTDRPVLAPMVPFGHYLKHAGTFFGFQHHLASTGAALESLGGDWYRVRVPNEGSIVVKTSISAEEEPKRDTPCARHCRPAVEVEHTARCFCSAPGMSSAGAPGWLALALLTLLAAARAGRPRDRD